jgi:hypothetical protein
MRAASIQLHKVRFGDKAPFPKNAANRRVCAEIVNFAVARTEASSHPSDGRKPQHTRVRTANFR